MTGKHLLWDELFEGFETAVADIRQKVVEEPWFSRPVTHCATGPEVPSHDRERDQPRLASADEIDR